MRLQQTLHNLSNVWANDPSRIPAIPHVDSIPIASTDDCVNKASTQSAMNERGRKAHPVSDSKAPTSSEFKPSVAYSMSNGFVALLARLDTSVAVSSYQSGKFYLMGRTRKAV